MIPTQSSKHLYKIQVANCLLEATTEIVRMDLRQSIQTYT